MTRRFFIALSSASTFTAAAQAQPLLPVPAKDSTRIPVVVLDNADAIDTARLTDKDIVMTAGGADELPIGPVAFELDDDGGYIFADPLRRRIAFFAKDGAYQHHWDIGFAADQITNLGSGKIAARKASTGITYILDGISKPQPAPPDWQSGQSLKGYSAVLSGDNQAVVETPQGMKVAVRPSAGRLIAVRLLKVDQFHNLFVLVECSSGKGEAITLTRSVHKYNSTGNLLVEIPGLSAEFFLPQEDDVRIRNARVVQMVSAKGELVLGSWAVPIL